jgi:LEA14-like dessication related protein
MLEGTQRPAASIAGVAIEDIGLDGLTLRFDIRVENPYDAALPLADIDYTLAARNLKFLSGKTAMEGAVPPRGARTVALPAKVAFKQLMEILKDVRPGAVVPYAAEMGLSVNAPVVGPLRLPLRHDGRLPIPAPPDISITEIKWDAVTLDYARGRVRLAVVNRNSFAVNLTKLNCALSLGGTEVATCSVEEKTAFAAGGAQDLNLPIGFAPKQAGLAVLGLLTGKGAGYGLKGTVDLATPYGPVSLPVEKAGSTIFK